MKIPHKTRRIVEELQRHPKVIAALLFGSWARNGQMPLSDIDIAVFLKDPTPGDEADVGSMYSNEVDLVLFHRLPLYNQFEVLREGVELFMKDREVFDEIVYKTIRDYHEMESFFREIETEVMK